MGQIDGPLRVIYMPMMGSGRQVRFGVLVTASGPSGLVQFDDCNGSPLGAQWVPLERLHRVEVRLDGWWQLMLWAEGGR